MLDVCGRELVAFCVYFFKERLLVGMLLNLGWCVELGVLNLPYGFSVLCGMREVYMQGAYLTPVGSDGVEIRGTFKETASISHHSSTEHV